MEGLLYIQIRTLFAGVRILMFYSFKESFTSCCNISLASNVWTHISGWGTREWQTSVVMVTQLIPVGFIRETRRCQIYQHL